MQRIIPESKLHAVRTRLLEEIKVTKKRTNPVHHPLFNLTMQNKIDHANRILRIMDRYPNMTVKELLFLIESRIEGEKFVISSYRRRYRCFKRHTIIEIIWRYFNSSCGMKAWGSGEINTTIYRTVCHLLY